nr:nucleolar protein dao-5-like [Procambarus clarkii]
MDDIYMQIDEITPRTAIRNQLEVLDPEETPAPIRKLPIRQQISRRKQSEGEESSAAKRIKGVKPKVTRTTVEALGKKVNSESSLTHSIPLKETLKGDITYGEIQNNVMESSSDSIDYGVAKNVRYRMKKRGIVLDEIDPVLSGQKLSQDGSLSHHSVVSADSPGDALNDTRKGNPSKKFKSQKDNSIQKQESPNSRSPASRESLITHLDKTYDLDYDDSLENAREITRQRFGRKATLKLNVSALMNDLKVRKNSAAITEKSPEEKKAALLSDSLDGSETELESPKNKVPHGLPSPDGKKSGIPQRGGVQSSSPGRTSRDTYKSTAEFQEHILSPGGFSSDSEDTELQTNISAALFSLHGDEEEESKEARESPLTLHASPIDSPSNHGVLSQSPSRRKDNFHKSSGSEATSILMDSPRKNSLRLSREKESLSPIIGSSTVVSSVRSSPRKSIGRSLWLSPSKDNHSSDERDSFSLTSGNSPRQSIGKDSMLTKHSTSKSVGSDAVLSPKHTPKKSSEKDSVLSPAKHNTRSTGKDTLSPTKVSHPRAGGNVLSPSKISPRKAGRSALSSTKTSPRRSVMSVAENSPRKVVLSSPTKTSPRKVVLSSPTKTSPRKVVLSSPTKTSPRKVVLSSPTKTSPRKVVLSSPTKTSPRKVVLSSPTKTSPRKVVLSSPTKTSPRKVVLSSPTKTSPRKVVLSSPTKTSPRKVVLSSPTKTSSRKKVLSPTMTSPRKKVLSPTKPSPRGSVMSVAEASPRKNVLMSPMRTSPRRSVMSVEEDSPRKDVVLSPTKTSPRRAGRSTLSPTKNVPTSDGKSSLSSPIKDIPTSIEKSSFSPTNVDRVAIDNKTITSPVRNLLPSFSGKRSSMRSIVLTHEQFEIHPEEALKAKYRGSRNSDGSAKASTAESLSNKVKKTPVTDSPRKSRILMKEGEQSSSLIKPKEKAGAEMQVSSVTKDGETSKGIIIPVMSDSSAFSLNASATDKNERIVQMELSNEENDELEGTSHKEGRTRTWQKSEFVQYDPLSENVDDLVTKNSIHIRQKDFITEDASDSESDDELLLLPVSERKTVRIRHGSSLVSDYTGAESEVTAYHLNVEEEGEGEASKSNDSSKQKSGINTSPKPGGSTSALGTQSERLTTSKTRQMTMKEFIQKLADKPMPPPRTVNKAKDETLLANLLKGGSLSTVRKPPSQIVVTRKTREKKPLPATLSKSVTKEIFTHFAKCKVSDSGMNAVMEVCETFWKNLSTDLTNIKNARKGPDEILCQDIRKLMTRQGLITDENSLFALVEKYLPVEDWNTIIPTAFAKGNVYPPEKVIEDMFK